MKPIYVPCLIVVAGHIFGLAAQSTGTFSPTGDMHSGRFCHSATLLPNGKVLIAGGILIAKPGEFATTSGAELYDPTVNSFSLTGEMAIPRACHTATLLPDGKVLIAGGGAIRRNEGSSGSFETVDKAELYDPDTGTFTATGSMAAKRWLPTATLLNDGKVLMAGGSEPSSTAELYDPSTGTFTTTGNMTGISVYTATLLPNGKVLLTSGYPAELYDPSSGTFASTGHMVATHGRHAVLLADGKVLFAGGEMGEGYPSSNTADLYDPVTGLFSSAGVMNAGRGEHTTTLLPDSTVLVVGGFNMDGIRDYLVSTAEVYDPLHSTFTSIASMTTSREAHTATLLSDGRVLIAGGDDDYWIPDTTYSRAELYTPAVLVPAPMLLSLSNDGRGQGAIWHSATGRIASSQDPAVAGEILSMYTTSLIEGGMIPPQVVIGRKLAEVLFFGDAPGYPGYYQVNFRVPESVAPGASVSVRLMYMGRSSNEVTIGVR